MCVVIIKSKYSGIGERCREGSWNDGFKRIQTTRWFSSTLPRLRECHFEIQEFGVSKSFSIESIILF